MPVFVPLALFAQWKRRGKVSDDPEFTYTDAETWLLRVALALPILIIAGLVCVYLIRRVGKLAALLFKKSRTRVDGSGPAIQPLAEKRPPSEPSDSPTGTTPPPV